MRVSNKAADQSENLKSSIDAANDDNTIKNVDSTKKVLFFVAGTVVLVGFCVAAAAVMSKCRKRGSYDKAQVEFSRLIDDDDDDDN